jgi:hypothetical protein
MECGRSAGTCISSDRDDDGAVPDADTEDLPEDADVAVADRVEGRCEEARCEGVRDPDAEVRRESASERSREACRERVGGTAGQTLGVPAWTEGFCAASARVCCGVAARVRSPEPDLDRVRGGGAGRSTSVGWKEQPKSMSLRVGVGSNSNREGLVELSKTKFSGLMSRWVMLFS